MSIIRLLSETTINKIAAGEVVERPSSVVKELVENALDAGADRVDVVLEQAGKNLIMVSDNGHGISQQDLPVAIQRHTTSKLNEDDIMNISSFGFRGEALPSIGSVSRMIIESRVKNAGDAYALSVEGGTISDVKLGSLISGTQVTIRDLFFATPARLKFLRSDKTELAACVDIMKKIAMANHSCSFTLSHNDKQLLKLRGNSDLNQRIIEILGDDFVRNSASISAQREEIEIVGLTSLPTYNRATSEDQYLFINNRPVKDKLLSAALRVAYQDYLARDRFPVAAIFINTNPYFVDVNVHPAKTEVRFRDSNLMRGLLISSIRDALGKVSHNVSDTISAKTIAAFTSEPSSSFHGHFASPQQQSYRPYGAGYRENSYVPPPLFVPAPQMRIHDISEVTVEEKNFPLGAACAQLHETYIISQTQDSIIITDQHAAHERLTYEKLKTDMAKQDMPRQRLLIPEIIELPDAKRADKLAAKQGDLAKLGLSLEFFGEKSVIVNEIPQVIGDVNISQLIHDIADNLLELEEDASLNSIIEHVVETYACHHSIRAGKKLSVPEMNHLLREMEATPFSVQCNHGRPTYIELKLKDVEKLFGRS